MFHLSWSVTRNPLKFIRPGVRQSSCEHLLRVFISEGKVNVERLISTHCGPFVRTSSTPAYFDSFRKKRCFRMRHFLFWMAVTILGNQVRRVQHPVSPAAVAAPGDNTTLECSFSASKNLNLTNLIINWQHGETVVHSFYLGLDQLDRQGQAYRGRTRLFKDQLLEGNASLRLIRMQPDDEGDYTCYVNSEQDSTTRKLKVILAALYDEPLLSLQPTCDSINITATFSSGFPQPEIRWLDSSGSDIFQSSTVQLDTRGRYKVSSTISSRLNAIKTITMEMKLEVLNQSFTRSLLLHPLPDPCQECSSTPFTSRNRTAMATVVTLFVIVLILMFAVRKWKASHGQQEREQAT